jgi:hypothetical protein
MHQPAGRDSDQTGFREVASRSTTPLMQRNTSGSEPPINGRCAVKLNVPCFDPLGSKCTEMTFSHELSGRPRAATMTSWSSRFAPICREWPFRPNVRNGWKADISAGIRSGKSGGIGLSQATPARLGGMWGTCPTPVYRVRQPTTVCRVDQPATLCRAHPPTRYRVRPTTRYRVRPTTRCRVRQPTRYRVRQPVFAVCRRCDLSHSL